MRFFLVILLVFVHIELPIYELGFQHYEEHRKETLEETESGSKTLTVAPSKELHRDPEGKDSIAPKEVGPTPLRWTILQRRSDSSLEVRKNGESSETAKTTFLEMCPVQESSQWLRRMVSPLRIALELYSRPDFPTASTTSKDTKSHSEEGNGMEGRTLVLASNKDKEAITQCIPSRESPQKKRGRARRLWRTSYWILTLCTFDEVTLQRYTNICPTRTCTTLAAQRASAKTTEDCTHSLDRQRKFRVDRGFEKIIPGSHTDARRDEADAPKARSILDQNNGTENGRNVRNIGRDAGETQSFEVLQTTASHSLDEEYERNLRKLEGPLQGVPRATRGILQADFYDDHRNREHQSSMGITQSPSRGKSPQNRNMGRPSSGSRSGKAGKGDEKAGLVYLQDMCSIGIYRNYTDRLQLRGRGNQTGTSEAWPRRISWCGWRSQGRSQYLMILGSSLVCPTYWNTSCVPVALPKKVRFHLDVDPQRDDESTWDDFSSYTTSFHGQHDQALPTGEVDFAAVSSAWSLATEVLLETWADRIASMKDDLRGWVGGSLSEMAVLISPTLENHHSNKHLQNTGAWVRDPLSELAVSISPVPSDDVDATDDPNDSVPQWVSDLWDTVFEPQAEVTLPFSKKTVKFLTWYLDHQRHRECHSQRILYLDAKWQEWETNIRQCWTDLVLHDHAISVHLVQPEPPRADGEEHQGHLVISQQVDDEISTSLTAIKENELGDKQAWRCAMTMPRFINSHDVLRTIGEAFTFPNPSTWIVVDDVVLSDEYHKICHGTSVVAFHSERRSNFDNEEAERRELPGNLDGNTAEESDDVTMLAHQAQRLTQQPPLLQQPGIANDDDDPEEPDAPDEDEDMPSDDDESERRQTVSILTLGHAPFLARVRWREYEHMASDCAAHLGWHKDDVIYTFDMNFIPRDLRASRVAPLIVQHRTDLHDGNRLRYVVLDFDFYQRWPAAVPRTWRTLKLLPPEIHHGALLRILRLKPYCDAIKQVLPPRGCLLWHNGQIVRQQNQGLMRLEHGDYLQFAVPPHDDHCAPTEYSVRGVASGLQLHQIENNYDTHLDTDEEFDHVPPRETVLDSWMEPDYYSMFQQEMSPSLCDIQRQIPLWVFNEATPIAELATEPINVDLLNRWHAEQRIDEDGQLYACFETWHLSGFNQPRRYESRRVFLYDDVANWRPTIQHLWRDVIDPIWPTDFFLVSGEVPVGADEEEIAGHILVLQHETPEMAAVLGTVMHLTETSIRLEHLAYLTPTPTRCPSLLQKMRINSDCPPIEPTTMCTCWLDSLRLQDDTDHQIAHGNNIVVYVQQNYAEQSDDVTHLMQRPAWEQQHEFFEELHFIEDLSEAWRTTATTGTMCEPSANVVTYFLKPGVQHICAHPRTVTLHSDPGRWLAILSGAWDDLVQPEDRLRFWIVKPNPLGTQRPVCAHVLIGQDLPRHQKYILTSLYDQTDPSPSHVATIEGESITPQTLLVNVARLGLCGVRRMYNGECQIMLGDEPLSASTTDIHPNNGDNYRVLVLRVSPANPTTGPVLLQLAKHLQASDKHSEDIEDLQIDLKPAWNALSDFDSHFILPVFDLFAPEVHDVRWHPAAYEWLDLPWYDYNVPCYSLHVYFDGSCTTTSSKIGFAAVQLPSLTLTMVGCWQELLQGTMIRTVLVPIRQN